MWCEHDGPPRTPRRFPRLHPLSQLPRHPVRGLATARVPGISAPSAGANGPFRFRRGPVNCPPTRRRSSWGGHRYSRASRARTRPAALENCPSTCSRGRGGSAVLMPRVAAALEAALSYAEQGIPVFPVWGIWAGRCGCGEAECSNAGKHPVGHLVPAGLKDATTDPATIGRWWKDYAAANVATPTSWCVVLDVDPRHGGDESLRALEREHGPLPETAIVITGSGGRHYYFARPTGIEIRNSAGRVGPGLDVRGQGGYVLLPPSQHVSASVYTDDPDHPLSETTLAEIPPWLLARLQAPVAPSTNGAATASQDWSGLLEGVRQGQRHQALTQLAGHFLGKA